MPIQMQGNEIGNLGAASASITTEASITATTSATGNTCISTGAFNVANSGNYWVEVFTPYLTKGTTNLDVELFEGATAAAGTFLQTLRFTRATERDTCAEDRASHHVPGHGAGTGATGQPPPARIQVVTS